MKGGRSYLVINQYYPAELWGDTAAIDRLEIDCTDLDIKSARQLVAKAAQQPLGSTRMIVLTHADSMSEAVQNTLLKLLEEPLESLTLVVVTLRPESLLPTVRSRLHPVSTQKTEETAEEITALPTRDQLGAELSRHKDRSSLANALSKIRSQAGGIVLSKPSLGLVESIDLLDRSIRRLGQNANQKLVLDALLLNWPAQSSRSEDRTHTS